MKRLLLLFIILAFAGNNLFSQHLSGYISYEHITGYTYKFTVTTYDKISVDKCEMLIYFGDGDSVFAPRINGPLSPSCAAPGGMVFSSCINATYSIYSVLHTYSDNASYAISAIDFERDFPIENLLISSGFTLRAELVINPFLAPNSSPQYAAAGLVGCSCVGIPYSFNPGFSDVNSDSLYYENSFTGFGGYTDPNSDVAFTINNSTGDILWNKPQAMGENVYGLKISEWRLSGGTPVFAGSSMMELINFSNICTGIDDHSNDVTVNVFPNPAVAEIHFSVPELPAGKTHYLNISNSLGQLIQKTEIAKDGQVITLNGLSAGIYFYSLTGEKVVLNKGKFVIWGDPVK